MSSTRITDFSTSPESSYVSLYVLSLHAFYLNLRCVPDPPCGAHSLCYNKLLGYMTHSACPDTQAPHATSILSPLPDPVHLSPESRQVSHVHALIQYSFYTSGLKHSQHKPCPSSSFEFFSSK